MGRLMFAVECHDERQSDRYLSRRDRNDEEYEHLTVQCVVEPGKRHEGKIGGIEHQLQSHVNNQQIAPHDHAHQTEREEQHANDQIMFESDSHRFETYIVTVLQCYMVTSHIAS